MLYFIGLSWFSAVLVSAELLDLPLQLSPGDLISVRPSWAALARSELGTKLSSPHIRSFPRLIRLDFRTKKQ